MAASKPRAAYGKGHRRSLVQYSPMKRSTQEWSLNSEFSTGVSDWDRAIEIATLSGMSSMEIYSHDLLV